MADVVVVDASIAIKWVFTEADSVIAKALLKEWIATGKVILAPVLFAYEAANTLHRKTLKGQISHDKAKIALKELFTTGLELEEVDLESNIKAMEVANKFNLPTVYDAHYLGLAEKIIRIESRECEFWTADTRLWNSVKGKFPWTRWMADYQLA